MSRITFWQILNNEIENVEIPKGIEIPMIQRDYAQGRNNIKTNEIRTVFLNNILDSIKGVLSDSKPPLELDFIYGYIEHKKFIPLDGQQRLTTLFLLHWFLAFKDKLIEINKYSEVLSKFKYQTRKSSEEFTQKLIFNLLEDDYNKIFIDSESISAIIKNKNWFFASWEQDITITSMLNMLDEIHLVFKDSDINFSDIINSQNPCISFNFLDIKDFGLSDDLYIKMNSRGKPLTSFEELKAELSRIIETSTYNDSYNFELKHSEGVKKVDVKTYFSLKIDTIWSDYFWKLRDIENNIFDDKLLNILTFISLSNINYDTKNQFDEIRNNFYDEGYYPSFYQLNKLGLLNEKTIIDFIYFLDILVSNNQTIIKYLKSNIYINKIGNEIDLDYLYNDYVFNQDFNANYIERIQFYGILKFIKAAEFKDNFECEIYKFERLIYNLTISTNFFNSSDDFFKSLKGIDTLLENYNGDIYTDFISTNISGFDTLQILEEKIKVTLILKNKKWEDLILKVESQKYLNQQINFLLTFSGIQEFYYIDSSLNWDEKVDLKYYNTLLKYFNKYLLYFDDNGLKVFKNELFRAALLSIGDYLIYYSNWCFVLSNNDRNVSWKRYFREIFNNKKEWNDKANYLLKLLNSSDLKNSAEVNLIEILKTNAVDSKDWRYNFIKYPQLINLKDYFIYIHNDENEVEIDIHLLNKTRFSNKALEVQTLIVKFELEKNGFESEIDFSEKYGRSGIISINNKKIKVFYNIDLNKEFFVKIYNKTDFTSKRRSKTIQYILSNL